MVFDVQTLIFLASDYDSILSENIKRLITFKRLIF